MHPSKCPHIGQTDQIDHDLDHLDANLPLCEYDVQDLYYSSSDPTWATCPTVVDHADSAAFTRQHELHSKIITDQESIWSERSRS